MAESRSSAASGEVSLGRVMVFNWLLLAVLTGLGWWGYSGFHALSVFIGGAIANLSFLFLKRDLIRLLAGPLEAVKPLFFMRYYLRLFVVVGVLFLLVRYQLVHTLALLVGLSTVLLSIGLAVMVAAKSIYSTK
ncbi:ATP synthase subunit I [Thiovibrio frasassiensis]|uniref:ATP synthase subunit I n=1 Tax=Thiovibrio frasassiensis TaxID=2984131 RepID=A0A9X4RPH2_9BACT|nr:ATP synthase subunit I [Thiovibrio frasassiensis]MDG4475252.1 ATP synthase subunit I [Thiovibrio frasassiensis]